MFVLPGAPAGALLVHLLATKVGNESKRSLGFRSKYTVEVIEQPPRLFSISWLLNGVYMKPVWKSVIFADL